MSKIDKLTIKELREAAEMYAGLAKTASPTPTTPHGWVIGELYLIRTVSMAQAGRLVAVTDQELVLEDASWVADTGRFGAAVASGDFRDVEMFPAGTKVMVGRGAISDATPIPKLPTSNMKNGEPD